MYFCRAEAKRECKKVTECGLFESNSRFTPDVRCSDDELCRIEALNFRVELETTEVIRSFEGVVNVKYALMVQFTLNLSSLNKKFS